MQTTLWGPFSQLLTLRGLPTHGPIKDSQLEIIEQAGLLVNSRGNIVALGPYPDLKASHNPTHTRKITQPTVAIPGLIDCHTHICFAGSRAADYQRRLSGATYQEIAKAGGGILDSVRNTRAATQEDLTAGLLKRCTRLRQLGVTTCEVKSGYGLTVASELKILHAIRAANNAQPLNLIPTCLAAHTLPPEFTSHAAYLQTLRDELFPQLDGLSSRIDIFVDPTAFSIDDARSYLRAARQQGFTLTIHADQFVRGGSALAAEVGAISADHLEATHPDDYQLLKQAGTIPVLLPGATLGLGQPFPHARAILNAGLPLAIASDWNPGSAPMGHLLLQAALLGASQKLSYAETLAAITTQPASALNLTDRGTLNTNLRADLALFPTNDYREILYQQGMLLPYSTLIQGDDKIP